MQNSQIIVNVDVKPGNYVREPGSDIRIGEELLESGELVTSVAIGLLASCGVSSLLCYPQPIVGVLSTGNEVVASDTKTLHDSQVMFITATLISCHCALRLDSR